jgi:hypothetical protein
MEFRVNIQKAMTSMTMAHVDSLEKGVSNFLKHTETPRIDATVTHPKFINIATLRVKISLKYKGLAGFVTMFFEILKLIKK